MTGGRVLVSLEDVRVDYYGSRMLQGVTWKLREREHWGLVGPNGSGKSSLLKLVKGELWPHFENGGRRVYHLDGEPTESSVEARRKIVLLSAESQEAYRRHRWDMSGLEVILSGKSAGPWFQGTPSPEMREQATEVAHDFEAGHLLDKSILVMSEGEARRVLLAKAIFTDPKILLLDEYLNGLDAPSRKVIRKQMARIAESGRTLVLTGHRPGDFPPHLTHFARLDRGRIAETGPWKASSGKPALISGKRASINGHQGTPLVAISNADVVINGTRILHDINWYIHPGECHVVTGPNGSGKSTFLRLVLGEQPPYLGGDVRWLGRSDGWKREDRMSLFGIVSTELQESHRLDVCALDVVTSGYFSTIGLHGNPSAEQRREASVMLKRVGMGGRDATPFGELSFGERRRLLLARALVHKPRVLVLDEATNGLDRESLDVFGELLAEAFHGGVSIVYTTHHEEEAPDFTTRWLEMNHGRLHPTEPATATRGDGR